MSKILKCQGYKMFEGTMLIVPTNPQFPTMKLQGTWLYKPEYDCWYGAGGSYGADICTPIDNNGNPLE